MPTNKKAHDKDKYYHLAKDQGYRARSAFKLIQINKRFNFLSQARVCIDLCAAPGGWCQVAVQLMPKGSLVLGVDLLPIRPIRGVKTLINDITTAECRRNVREELKDWKADVVLCDGAPNIGSAYHKDAFVQNELVLAALKTATDHLVRGGVFCTKVYRSTDYNALMWVFQQLFEDVQAIKPSSSRAQSSEIFIVCLQYTKPDKIDPKFLDPNHIFKQVADPGNAKVDVMHKKYDKMNKRHRTGYDDWENGLLTSGGTVSAFIDSTEPIRVLTDCNSLAFTDECKEKYLDNKFTTPELVECCKDLRVLGKTDFKKMLKWRQRLRDWMEMERKEAAGEEAPKSSRRSAEDEEANKEETEEDIYEQIMEMRAQAAQEERRLKKKTREGAAKERTRQALGMSANIFDGAQVDTELFSFSSSRKGRKIVDDALDEYGQNEDIIYSDSEDEDAAQREKAKTIFLPDAEETLADEMETDYTTHRKNSKKKTHEKLNERGHKLSELDDEQLANKLLHERELEDATNESVLRKSASSKEHAKQQQKAYVELLSKGSQKETGSRRQAYRDKKAGKEDGAALSGSDTDSSEDEDENVPGHRGDSDSDSDSGSYSEASVDTDSDGVGDDITRILKSKANTSKNDQWFSHPIFKETVVDEDDDDKDSRGSDDENEDDDMRMSQAARDAIDSMPKTDKQKRQEKRKKEAERAERKNARRERKDAHAKVEGSDMPRPTKRDRKQATDEDSEDSDADIRAAMSANPEIRDGMGRALKKKAKTTSTGFEVVPRTEEDEFEEMRMDENRYDSEEESYTATQRAEQLALGTLMLRKSRRKALVDASYNRFSWNDNTNDLPSWFVDDEMKHNKPQIPIPPALLEQIKSKFQMTGTKSIKKVEEAKMRKKKHAQAKLKAAKKQANSLADNQEMSEKEKLKAVQRAMKNSKADKPSKVYVVSRKTGGGSSATKTSSGKGSLKFVDKRMKSDKRGEKNAAKKKRGKGKGKK